MPKTVWTAKPKPETNYSVRLEVDQEFMELYEKVKLLLPGYNGTMKDVFRKLLGDYENRNCGRFRRIFPCDDRARQAKYLNMLTTAFSLFLSGRGNTMQKEIETNYANKLRVK